MPYNTKYNDDLREIINLIIERKIEGTDGALEKFQQHINEVKDIGRFSIDDWNVQWRKNVYELGAKFKNIDPIAFLNIITAEKSEENKDKQEVLDFYYSEIEYNSLPDESFVKKIEALVSKYPYNPEFRHTFGHFYVRINEYANAIVQYKFAYSKNKRNSTFFETLFNTYMSYFETLIDKSEYEKGLNLCKNLIAEKTFSDIFVYSNHLIYLKERFKDYIVLNEKIADAEVKIKEIATKETQKGQIRVIEILGFFTAIIAFIFSTVSIGKNFSFDEAIIFNISLGITLMIFVLLISIFFSPKSVKSLDIRMLLFFALVLCLLLIVSKFGAHIFYNS
ncbi:MAG: hypothetical protein K8S18_04535 [Desulfobacula sp.]|nr:hypothetical protein [Desulfobacula sp.]